MTKLSLFPLKTVLFPGAPIVLHIFEDRYRLMLGRCLDQQLPFGVVLIREGSEVDPGDPGTSQQREALGLPEEIDYEPFVEVMPYLVGTVAQIGEYVQLEDGRYYLVALGQRRFRIQYIVQRKPYMVASVTYLPEDIPADITQPARQLRSLYLRYWQALGMATGHEQKAEPPPTNPVELTYWMAHRLQVSNPQKQRWLEADVATRLREMNAALRAELALLPPVDSDDSEGTSSWNGPSSWN